jgi:hypothetical protein
MSYDIELFPLEPGLTPMASFLRRQEREERVTAFDVDDVEAVAVAVNPGIATPESEARKEATVQALRQVDPTLTLSPKNYRAIAAFERVSVEEAARRHRDIELNQPGPPEGMGVQITLLDDSARVSLPYWYRGDAARRAFGIVSRHARAISETAGYVAYDPQLGRVLASEQDVVEAIAKYEATTG